MNDLPDNEFLFDFPLFGLVANPPTIQVLFAQAGGRVALVLFTDEPGAESFARKAGYSIVELPGPDELRAFCHGLAADTVVALDPLDPKPRSVPTFPLGRFLGSLDR